MFVLGGRFSTEAGIDVDRGDREIERWFLAATLFGTRISTAIAIRTYRVLNECGVSTIDDAACCSWAELVELLDRGGYARYDERTARRLLDLAKAVRCRFPGGIAEIGRTITDEDEAAAVLDALPGWGPSTVGAFLRELRGVWLAAALPIDERVVTAARHIGLVGPSELFLLDQLQHLAVRAGIDARDLEAGLLRLALAHRRSLSECSPATACPILRRPPSALDNPARPVIRSVESRTQKVSGC